MANKIKNTHSIDDLIAKKMQDPEFAKGFNEEYNKLASAAALVEARLDAGLTQAQLAEKSNVPQTTIARIERGNNTSIETLSRLANALGKKVLVSIA